MSRKLAASKNVRKSAAEIPPASKADLERLHVAMESDVDTSDIPERRKFHRLKRDSSGKLPPRKQGVKK